MKRLVSCAALLFAITAAASFERSSGACRLAYYGRERPGALEDLGVTVESPPAPELVSAIEWYPREPEDGAGCACGEDEPLCGRAAYVDVAFHGSSAVWARVSPAASADASYYELTHDGEVSTFRLMLYELGAGLPKHVELTIAVLDTEGRRSPPITVTPDLMFY
jgi:hypothetical protein